MTIERLRKGVLVAALLVAAGCSNGDSSDTQAEDTGSVQLALVVVPTDVQCVRIVATGSRVRQQDFNVMSGQMSVLSMTGLPVGQVTFTGEAFPAGCQGGAMMPSATYVADPVITQINASGVTSLTLNMRRNGMASISVDFETGNMCLPAGGQCMAGSTTPCCSGLACQPDATGITSCQPPATCRPPGSPCGPGLTQQCCAGLTCTVDPASMTAICQPINACIQPGGQCMPGSTTPCCSGLVCQGDPSGITSCQPQNMCVPGGGQCGASTVCCSGLACQPDATGITSCQPLATCRPPGAPCGPGLTQQCCAGLTCQLDPAGGMAICL